MTEEIKPRTKTIWKFPLVITGLQTVMLPGRVQLLGIYLQRNTPMLYAIVEPDAPLRGLNIRCHGTGQTFDDHGSYPHHLGTVVMNDGDLVFHFFSARGTDEPLLID